MRVENWKPNEFDLVFENVAIERMLEAGQLVVQKARASCPVGIKSRPPYKMGQASGKDWTSREPGRLKDTIRVDRIRTKSGAISRAKSARNRVRISMGSEDAYYSLFVELKHHILTGALYESTPQIKSILGAK